MEEIPAAISPFDTPRGPPGIFGYTKNSSGKYSKAVSKVNIVRHEALQEVSDKQWYYAISQKVNYDTADKCAEAASTVTGNVFDNLIQKGENIEEAKKKAILEGIAAGINFIMLYFEFDDIDKAFILSIKS